MRVITLVLVRVALTGHGRRLRTVREQANVILPGSYSMAQMGISECAGASDPLEVLAILCLAVNDPAVGWQCTGQSCRFTAKNPSRNIVWLSSDCYRCRNYIYEPRRCMDELGDLFLTGSSPSVRNIVSGMMHFFGPASRCAEVSMKSESPRRRCSFKLRQKNAVRQQLRRHSQGKTEGGIWETGSIVPVWGLGQPKRHRHIYVLDGPSILHHTNQPEKPGWRWNLLEAAASYYQSRGYEVLVFMPFLSGKRAAPLLDFRQKIGLRRDCIMTTPDEDCNSAVMVQFVRDYPNNYVTRMVTNSKFNKLDLAFGRTDAWIARHTLKFSFARERFIPQYVESGEDRDPNLDAQQLSESSNQSAFILDGQNILHYSNEAGERKWDWGQLLAAGTYYKSRGHQVYIFLPKLNESTDAQLQVLQQYFGKGSIVTTPGASTTDNEFTINYAKALKYEIEARIVTNHLFMDGSSSLELVDSWVKANTIKYLFATGSFIPEYAVAQGQDVLRDAKQSAGETKQIIYLLDGQNILRHTNQLRNWPFLNWDQLKAAESYYLSRGHQALVFLPSIPNPDVFYVAQLEGLKQTFGSDRLILTPEGSSEQAYSAFMINYVREHEESCTARIVTNNQFGGRELSDVWIEDHIVKFVFAAGSFVPSSQGDVQQLAETSQRRVYALHGLGILQHVNQAANLSQQVRWNWDQLSSAGSHYGNSGHEVFIFLPRARLQRSDAAQLQLLRKKLGPDSIVMTPAGFAEDAFMINYVKDYPKNRIVSIVTNNNFRELDASLEVSEPWVKRNTVKFTFDAGGRFIPQDSEELQQEFLETKSVLEARMDALGPDHPDTLRSKEILISTLQTLGDMEGADELQREIDGPAEYLIDDRSPPGKYAEAEEQPEDTPMVLETFEDAEARGEQFFVSGQFDSAMRMFELAPTLPTASTDNGTTTEEQSLRSQYNVACCCTAMGNNARAIQLLRHYVSKVGEPMEQVHEMLVDPDLAGLRDEIVILQKEMQRGSEPNLFNSFFGGV